MWWSIKRGIKMDLSYLKKLTKDEILSGSFGIERETLRVHSLGELSLTPHPEIFGDKITNPIVTTDFSESQIEIITPTFNNIDKAFRTFCSLSDMINESLPENEYFWFYSLPSILPEENEIPIAQYGDDEEGQKSEKYRIKLAKKYGLKKQMISGIHFNFSFGDETLKKLYSLIDENFTYEEFKNEIYLKITRNYIRYCWLVIYLTGSSIACHKTFTSECIDLMDKQDKYGDYYSTKGSSLRNGSCGYKNLKKLYPSYNSVEEFTKDVTSYIESGDLSEAKELYAQIRLKPKNPKDMLNSLNETGIEYIEIRTLDINPFYRCGLTKRDMQFLHLFIIYMLVKNESDYENWQEEALINEELTAERAFDDKMRLIKDGEEITLKEWGLELIDEMHQMVDELGINYHDMLDLMKLRLEKPHVTYSRRLCELIKEQGYIYTIADLSLKNKHKNKNTKINEIEEYRKLALRQI